MTLVIVDTGCANLSSVAFAFKRLGVEAVISDNVETILDADKLILPGVGSAAYAMANIEKKNLIPVLKSADQPLLGICLGMQILFDQLTEGGVETTGLGLIPGVVTALDTRGYPSPHMGWNILEISESHPLLTGLTSADYAYFVHSYAAPLGDYTLAKSTYGMSFSAVVGRKNVYGCQFHPERSSQTGAQILKNFLDMPA